MYAGHFDLNHPLWWTLPDVLDPAACQALIARMDATPAETAPITGSDGGYVVDEKVRNNTRIMFRDAARAQMLFERVRDHIPDVLQGRPVVGANDWLRCYRYGPGQRHGVHSDTTVRLTDGRISLLTFIVYLNADFEGGRTLFPEIDVAVTPKPGLALLFQHKALHEAEAIVRGAKYVLRSEIMFQDTAS